LELIDYTEYLVIGKTTNDIRLHLKKN
jgi:hypothetical protein